MFLTIFTPTYNRAYIIKNLYESLKRQTCKEFEWLVVDDGSTDNTEELFHDLTKETEFPVRYIKQQNGGKHRAINYGIREAKGNLFFIVDSDDYLADNAVERIAFHCSIIKDKEDYAGLSGMRAYPNGSRIGGEVEFEILDCSALEYRFKYNVEGDSAEIYKTKLFVQFLFPDIEGEKFCPEALVWNRMANAGYKMHYFNEKIYVCDYLPDGLTAKITRIRMQSPKASMLYYSELARAKVPIGQKVKAAINYWRFSFCSNESFRFKEGTLGFKWIFALPIGYMMHIKDKKQL